MTDALAADLLDELTEAAHTYDPTEVAWVRHLTSAELAERLGDLYLHDSGGRVQARLLIGEAARRLDRDGAA